nr:protein NOI4-like [Malus domestica]
MKLMVQVSSLEECFNINIIIINISHPFHKHRLGVDMKLMVQEKGRPLSKFGEWDVNDPASAEGFTVIFNKARDEKKTGGKPESPGKVDPNIRHGGVDTGTGTGRPSSKKWFCSIHQPPAVLLTMLFS